MVLERELGLIKLLRGNLVFCPSICYVNRGGTTLAFRPLKQVLDFDLLTSILLNDGKIVGIPKKLISYRRHLENFSLKNNQVNVRFDEERKLYEELETRSDVKGWARAASVANRKFIVYAHYYFINFMKF